jgi:hypothetical protein
MSDQHPGEREKRRVEVFFYGSFMNRNALRSRGFEPLGWRTAVAVDHKVVFRPLATLERAAGEIVYGVVCSATHEELRALYAQDWLGAYQPEAILVHTSERVVSPALCYVAHGPTGPSPSADYVSLVADAARQHRFPSWYIQQIVDAGKLAAEGTHQVRTS